MVVVDAVPGPQADLGEPIVVQREDRLVVGGAISPDGQLAELPDRGFRAAPGDLPDAAVAVRHLGRSDRLGTRRLSYR
jgi:hypothetical protein